jgi:hypothetical protein
MFAPGAVWLATTLPGGLSGTAVGHLGRRWTGLTRVSEVNPSLTVPNDQDSFYFRSWTISPYCRRSRAVGGSGSTVSAPRYKALASHPCRAASLLARRPWRGAATIDASGKALRPSCSIVLMTAQATIIVE